MALKVSRQALSDIRAADAWWRANRPTARELFSLELRQAFRLLEEQPQLGSAAADSAAQGIRRLYLRGTRYFLYFSPRRGPRWS